MRIWKVVCSLALAACLIILAGCSKTQDQEPAKRQIQAGGYLNYGSLYEPGTLNPLLTDVLSTWEVGRLIFSGLVQTDEKGQWLPDLAAEVPTYQNGGISADGKTVIYKLRQGVTWHDGQPFTAEDVKFTWQFIIDKKNNAFSQEGYSKISAIETPNPYMVVVRFKEYYPAYLGLFNIIVPKHALQDVKEINKAAFNRAPIGTGPFKFKEWKVAEAIVLEANTAYYRGKPNLDGINYKIIPDNNIVLTQLKAGEVDVVSNINIAQYDTVRSINNVQTLVTPSTVWEHLDFNLDNPMFKEGPVRQAIALSINKQAIISNILKSLAVVAVGDQPPFSWAYNTALSSPAHDVNAAKALLTQAGWKQGKDGIFEKDGKKLKFTLTTTAGNKVRESVAALISQQLQEAGIAVVVQAVDNKVFFEKMLKNRQFEAALFAWSAGIDPNNFNLWSSKAIPSAGNGWDGHNYAGWRNPEVDKLTLQARYSVDQEACKQSYYRIQELILQECPIIPLYFRSNIDVVKNTVVNFKPNPTAPAGNLWNAWQWGFVKQ